VTTDGGTGAGQDYRFPTQTNDGRILTTRERFFFLLRQDGTNANSPWQAPTGGSFYKSPIAAQIAPSGGTVAWAFLHNTDVFVAPFQRVSFQTSRSAFPRNVRVLFRRAGARFLRHGTSTCRFVRPLEPP